MKKYLILFGVLAIVAIGSVAWLYAAPAPIVGLTKASPTFVTIKMPTLITVTSEILDPTVIPTGVNLMRVDDSGKAVAVMGRLHDDGIGGDAVAGDKIFTYRFAVNQSNSGLLAMQVSAAFKKVLLRSTSSIVVVAVSEDGILPPDPGNLGKVTLAGVDSNGNGVRDDVERYIAFTYPQSARQRASLTQFTIALQEEILGTGNDTLSRSNSEQVSNAVDCLNFTIMSSDADVVGVRTAYYIYLSLRATILNTPDRAKAYFQANSQLGAMFRSSVTFSEKAQRCMVNPSTLPN
jgi:hypothetical protein